ncbi:alpha/beta fold hydrolase [Sulfurospirillum arcachonense]|uniref:alpha/beta fold hydrolase n=1 Tax=Sulfurospirillum arcachonense TaxID=57666 RepID=UPI00046A7583|nr:alpha/beta hydrolase [Sulfurospirillum arcachonense]
MAIRNVLYNNQNYSISYEISNQDMSESIVFLHGWGSNKEIMKQAFGNEFENYKHIYIDLPGFGSSSINTPITTQDYADIIGVFLDSLHVKPLIIAGHSYGGKVAALLNPKNLILLSSAGIVVPKAFKIKMKIKIFKMFKNIVPKCMYKLFASDDVKGMSQTMYEIFKSVVDEDYRSVFAQVTSNTFIFWGKEDSATPLSSGVQISQIIKGSKFYPLEGDHFFFIKNAKFISKSINEQL